MGSLDLAEDAILGARSINPEQDLRRRLGLLPGFDGPEQPLSDKKMNKLKLLARFLPTVMVVVT